MKLRLRFRRLLVTAASCAVVACSNLGHLGSPEASRDDYWLKGASAASRADSLLLWFDYARRLSAAEWAREHEQLRLRSATDKSDFSRLRYAILLAVPNAPAREQARASSLLESLTKDAASRDAGMRALAQLLVTDLAERRRLAEDLQSTAQRQKDDAARAADLEQKLEALKEIEKNLQQRERRSAPGAAGGGK
jgi:hypothetical protein